MTPGAHGWHGILSLRVQPLLPRSKLFNSERPDYPNATLFWCFLERLTVIGAEWTVLNFPSIRTRYSLYTLCPVLANALAAYAIRFIDFRDDNEERAWLGLDSREARQPVHRMDLEYFRMAKLSMDADFAQRRDLEALFVLIFLAWVARGFGYNKDYREFGDVRNVSASSSVYNLLTRPMQRAIDRIIELDKGEDNLGLNAEERTLVWYNVARLDSNMSFCVLPFFSFNSAVLTVSRTPLPIPYQTLVGHFVSALLHPFGLLPVRRHLTPLLGRNATGR
jgi:hypothetical protein